MHSGEPRSYYFCHLCDVRYLAAHSMSTHLKKYHNLALPEGHSRFRCEPRGAGRSRGGGDWERPRCQGKAELYLPCMLI